VEGGPVLNHLGDIFQPPTQLRKLFIKFYKIFSNTYIISQYQFLNFVLATIRLFKNCIKHFYLFALSLFLTRMIFYYAFASLVV